MVEPEIRSVHDLLKQEENFSPLPYRCPVSGVWLMGYGHAIFDNPISIDDAEHVLETDVRECENEAARIMGDRCFSNLDSVRQGVVKSIVYQTGPGRFRRMTGFIESMQRGDYERAARCLSRSTLAKQTPARAKRYVEMLKTGQWPKMEEFS